MKRALALTLLAELSPAAPATSAPSSLSTPPHGPELLGSTEKAFEKAHPEIDVQWVDMGSQEVLDRIRRRRTTRS
jgi:ABC-type glycerol-3-phosphate transport system substrate-binding protein